MPLQVQLAFYVLQGHIAAPLPLPPVMQAITALQELLLLQHVLQGPIYKHLVPLQVQLALLVMLESTLVLLVHP